MCPCERWRHYVCGYHREQIRRDLLQLREAETDGRGYDDDIRALRGRLMRAGWMREQVEQELASEVS